MKRSIYTANYVNGILAKGFGFKGVSLIKIKISELCLLNLLSCFFVCNKIRREFELETLQLIYLVEFQKCFYSKSYFLYWALRCIDKRIKMPHWHLAHKFYSLKVPPLRFENFVFITFKTGQPISNISHLTCSISLIVIIFAPYIQWLTLRGIQRRANECLEFLKKLV